MVFSRHLVTPKLPTTLASHTRIDLPGYDVWFSFLSLAWVVPTTINVSKFECALSKVLQLYPHAAGQLRCIEGCWSIELTNTSVPVDVDYKSDMSSQVIPPDDWVVQDDLSLFTSPQPIGVDVINGSAPLLRLKLTFFGHETCIGLSWQHSLGDGIMILRFVHTLSQFYQDKSSQFPTPTFAKYHFSSAPTAVDFMSHMPRQLETSDSRQIANVKVYSSPGHVRWRIDNQDLEELQSILCARGRNGKLSKQDCLVAYVVAVLNHTQKDLIQKVRVVVSFRDVDAPFVSETAASNLIVQNFAMVPVDMVGIATAIRNSVIRCRQPNYIHGWVSVASKLVLETINSEKSLNLVYDDDLMVNSLARMDFCSAHFGCPSGTRFHMDRPRMRQMRLFKPNPVKGDDGVWQARQSVEISLGVPEDVKPMVLETLARGVRYMLDKELERSCVRANADHVLVSPGPNAISVS